jgi:hypothetical protein
MCNLNEMSGVRRASAAIRLPKQDRREAANENPVLICKLQKLFQTV